MELPEALDLDSSHVMPSSGTSLPHTIPFLARPSANLLLFDAVLSLFRSSILLHLTALKQSVAFHRCTPNVSQVRVICQNISIWELWADVTGLHTGRTSLLVFVTRCRLRYGGHTDYVAFEVRWPINQDRILLPA